MDTIYDFKKTEIAIPNSFFGPWKDKKIIDFQLILKDDKNEEIINEFNLIYFHIFIGINKVYCFISQDFGKSFDICCLNEKIRVYYRKMELKEFNYLENDTRARIVLINAPLKIEINNTTDLYSYVPLNFSKINSIQIAFFDSSANNYSVKAISKEEITEEFTIIEYLKEKKSILKKFYEELKDLIEKKQDDVEIFKNLTAGTDLISKKNNFSTRKEILSKAFNDDELYDLYYLYILWLVCDMKYFPEEQETEEKIECNLPINIIYIYIRNFYEKYKNDKDLLIYQRILLFYSNTIFFIKIDNIDQYNKCELEYINVKKIENNSVFGLSLKFLEDFIYTLNTRSYLFYPLLLLDSGLYYNRENKSIYGFDFQSCEKVKEHLKDLLPDVFFVYKLDSLDKEKGFNYKGMKTIFLNKSTVLENYNGALITENSNTKKVKHYAMRTSKFFMHECFGHNKFLYQQKIGIDSPRHFYNKEKKFITMIPKIAKSISYSNENNFYTNNKKFEGESGNFLEYFYGFYKDELVIDLLYNISDIGKLIDNVKYFTSEKLDNLKKYIIYKYLITKNNIKFNEKEDTQLEKDIEEMSLLLKANNINIDENKVQIKEKKSNIKRQDKPSKSLFIEIDEKEVKNYSYYLKKMNEAKTKDESRRYARELYFHHLKKE